MNKRIRIKDIAEKAGVSTGTVDRVIHKRGNVSKRAKEKVLKVMEELNYEPNIIASMLAYNRTFRVITLLPDFRTDLYWEQPKIGIERALEAVRHYGITIEPHYFDVLQPTQFLEKFDVLFQEPPDAILLAPIFLQESIQLARLCEEHDIPIALINANIIDLEALCYVGQDSYQSGVLAGKLLDFGLNNNEVALLLNLGEETVNAQHMISKEQGFRDYFSKREGKNIRIEKAEFNNFQDVQALQTFLSTRFLAEPDLKGLFVMNSRAFLVVENLPTTVLDTIKIVGFDLIAPNLKYLKENKINFLINQNPVQQGYLALINIVKKLVFKNEVERMQYLPLDIVVTENLDYYLRRQQEFQVVV